MKIYKTQNKKPLSKKFVDTRHQRSKDAYIKQTFAGFEPKPMNSRNAKTI